MDVAEVYSALWRDNLPRWACSDVAPEPLPTVGEPRWGTSLILRSSDKPALGALSGAARSIWLAAGEDQFAYTVDTLHVTVRVLDVYRHRGEADPVLLAELSEPLAQAASSAGRPVIDFRGVAPTSSGVIACGFPMDRTLSSLRATLEEAIEGRGLRSHEDLGERASAHASLLMVQAPLVDAPRVLGVLEELRSVEFGPVEFDRLDVVSYERCPRSLGIQTLRSVGLPPR